jgi:hypothetical protein
MWLAVTKLAKIIPVRIGRQRRSPLMRLQRLNRLGRWIRCVMGERLSLGIGIMRLLAERRQIRARRKAAGMSLTGMSLKRRLREAVLRRGSRALAWIVRMTPVRHTLLRVHRRACLTVVTVGPSHLSSFL